MQNKRVYALRGRWTLDTDRNCPPPPKKKKKKAKIIGFCIKGRVDNKWNSKKVQKIRGFMHEGAGGK